MFPGEGAWRPLGSGGAGPLELRLCLADARQHVLAQAVETGGHVLRGRADGRQADLELAHRIELCLQPGQRLGNARLFGLRLGIAPPGRAAIPGIPLTKTANND